MTFYDEMYRILRDSIRQSLWFVSVSVLSALIAIPFLHQERHISSLDLFAFTLPLVFAAFIPVASAFCEDNLLETYQLRFEEYGEFESAMEFRSLVGKNHWAKDSVTKDELDYILVLTTQLQSQYYPDVPLSIVLSMISYESSFDTNAVSKAGAKGLMQINEKFHEERIEAVTGGDPYDLSDPRTNLMIGIGYIDYLLRTYEGDIEKALTAYSKGIIGAADYYLEHGHCSSYATDVLERARLIDSYGSKILSHTYT